MMKQLVSMVLAFAFLIGVGALAAQAEDAPKEVVTTIHLDEYNGYFAAQETLAGLKPGDYEIVIQNKAQKTVGFLLQDAKTQAQLAMFPLEVGQTRSVRVKITANGFRYRCPINPTPWYEVAVK